MQYPITTLYAALLGLMLVFLSDRVSRNRKRSRVSLGSGGDDALERAMRAHANFSEYVPLGLILLFLLEAEASVPWEMHLFGIMLLLGRLLHAYGMMRPDGLISGRFWGTALTWLMILGASMLNLWHLV